VKFRQFIASIYPHMLTSFGRFNLMFNKIALIFLRVLFYRFKFRVSTSQIAMTSSLMMSGPSSPNFSPLDYQVWGKCWSLNKSCNRSQNHTDRQTDRRTSSKLYTTPLRGWSVSSRSHLLYN